MKIQRIRGIHMLFPTISRYAESVARPYGLFRTLGEPGCERDFHGRPRIFAGGNAAVFHITVSEKDYALKCFVRKVDHTRDVCRYIGEKSEGRLLLPAVYLPGEIFVYGSSGKGGWYDVVLMDWCDGRTLSFEIDKALHDKNNERLRQLAAIFDNAALEILSSEWAHGDIKPENIIVTPDNRLKLIDYDSMYFPSLEGSGSNQTGTRPWRHPRRNEHFFNVFIDDYPIAMLSATLHILSMEPSLYECYGNADRYLFDPADIVDGICDRHEYLLGRAAETANAPLYRLLEMLRTGTPRIEGLNDIIAELAGKKQEGENETGLKAFRRGAVWGYKDTEGRTVIRPMYDMALEFSEGLAAVRLGKHIHFINSCGICVINCAGYESVKSFSEGAAAVCSGGLWGYIDRDGNEIIPAGYEKAFPVRNGKARVLAVCGEKEIPVTTPVKDNNK